MLNEEPRQERGGDWAESKTRSASLGGRSLVRALSHGGYALDEEEDVEHEREGSSEKDAGSECLHPVLLEAHCGKTIGDALGKRCTGPKGAPGSRSQEGDAGIEQLGVKELRRLGGTCFGICRRAVRRQDQVRPCLENLETYGDEKEDEAEEHRKATFVDPAGYK